MFVFKGIFFRGLFQTTQKNKRKFCRRHNTLSTMATLARGWVGGTPFTTYLLGLYSPSGDGSIQAAHVRFGNAMGKRLGERGLS